jgi:hypothetical protein
VARGYLLRGMLVGLLAAIAAFGFAKLVGEPPIAKAEAFEAQVAQQRGEPHEHAEVSRAVQDTVGLGLGLVVAGTAHGGLFGLAFAFAYRRLCERSARATAVVLAACAFVGLEVLPFLKYPPNPPAVGDPETIGRRTALYFVFVAVSLLLVVLGGLVRRQLRPRLGTWHATWAGVAACALAATLAFVAFPGVDEVPDGFLGSVLWRFRLASLGTQALLWACIGYGFGTLTERAEARAVEAQRLAAGPALSR